jgi:hypothetical protein
MAVLYQRPVVVYLPGWFAGFVDIAVMAVCQCGFGSFGRP